MRQRGTKKWMGVCDPVEKAKVGVGQWQCGEIAMGVAVPEVGESIAAADCESFARL